VNDHAPKTWAESVQEVRSADLAVVGGGLAGLALAVAVAGAGPRVALIERNPLELTTRRAFDGRTTAVSPGSRRFLEVTGVWAAVAPSAEPILDIEVMEGFSPLSVHYDHRTVGLPLGHIVENAVLRDALVARARELPELSVLAPAVLEGTEREAGRARLRLADGRALTTPLIAACDGKGSPLRAAAGIRAEVSDYGQIALVLNLAHERPHLGRAIERFFPDGPFAMLPMRGRRSSIVWALDSALARDLIALDDEAFLAEAAERFGDHLGELRLDGARFSYPLQLVVSERFTDVRLALVGDAARGIHPIAGQGWNLGLRDVAALAEIVVDSWRLGLDPGGADALLRYAGWRRFDSLALVGVTDGLTRLFGNDILPLRIARELGLGLVDRLPPLKRLFMRHAMGELGDLPRTLRGEAL
jgi:2-octaprenyl-6-methoxyphenol hydroxylase